MTSIFKNPGVRVIVAGTGINLALGILYTWSIFKAAIGKSIENETGFTWDPNAINDPYAVCCLVFAFSMILAGKLQDRFGPRVVAMIGGALVGAGFILISQTSQYWVWILGFGVLAGMGIGFGYASATPPALKWFPPAKTGLIAGLVVSGFGLASVYIAPLSNYLVSNWGLQNAMLFFGIAFFIVVCCLSMLLKNPPPGFVPLEALGTKQVAAATDSVNLGPRDLFRSSKFYILWSLYFIGSGAGLMVIGSMSGMAKKSMGEWAFVAVAVLAIGNASGRIVAGVVSDRIGRRKTLALMLTFQAILMFLAIPLVKGGGGAVLVLMATLIGFNYGTNLSLFPSLTKDFWGLKNFGINYGIVFTAWGVGGFVMGRLSQMLKTSSGNYDSSFVTAGVFLILGAFLTSFLKKDESAVEEEIHPPEETKPLAA